MVNNIVFSGFMRLSLARIELAQDVPGKGSVVQRQGIESVDPAQRIQTGGKQGETGRLYRMGMLDEMDRFTDDRIRDLDADNTRADDRRDPPVNIRLKSTPRDLLDLCGITVFEFHLDDDTAPEHDRPHGLLLSVRAPPEATR